MLFIDNEPKQEEIVFHTYDGKYYSRLSSGEKWYVHNSDGTMGESFPPSGSEYAGSVYFLRDKKGDVFVANDRNEWEPI